MTRRLAVTAVIACTLASAQEPGSIRGHVFDASTGQPLSRVHVRLLVPSPGEGASAVYGALSDTEGRFSISPIPSGSYLLAPERPGYSVVFSDPAHAGPIVAIKPGKAIDDLRVDMARRAVITGHVLDEFGHAVSDVLIYVEPATENDPVEFAMEILGIKSVWTRDNSGAFRFSPPPGKYVLRVQGPGSRDVIQPDGSISSRMFVDTYYPGVPDRNAAKVVELKPGEQIGGIDIRLGAKQPLSVSGTVSGLLPDAKPSVFLRTEFGLQPRSVPVTAEGAFSAQHLAPGKYLVYAQSENGAIRLRSAGIDVDLSEASVGGLQLILKPPIRLTGVVKPRSGAQTVRLEPIADYFIAHNNLRTAPIAADGTFDFPAIEPERYKLSVFPLSEDAYVEGVALDGVAVTESAIDARFATDDDHSSLVPLVDARNGTTQSILTIAIGKGAHLSGTVGVGLGFGRVLLVPDGKTSQDDALYARVAADGTYAFRGLRPGKYRLITIDGSESFERLLARGRVIEVKEGDRIVVSDDGRE